MISILIKDGSKHPYSTTATDAKLEKMILEQTSETEKKVRRKLAQEFNCLEENIHDYWIIKDE